MNQPKTPGAMVLVERELLSDFLDYRDNGEWYDGIWITHKDRLRASLAAPDDHIEDARAMVEQTPDSPMAERIRQAMITDSSQDGVNIAEGRFGKAMAALCVQVDGQTPAFGGEPVYQVEYLGDGGGGWVDLEADEQDKYNRLSKFYRFRTVYLAEHVAPLRAEIERWRDSNKSNALAAGALVGGLQARIADLESELRVTKQAFESLKAERAASDSWQHLKPDMGPQKP